MTEQKVTFAGLAIKTMVVHTTTYFIAGLLASTIFDYATLFAEPPMNAFMRQTDDPLVAIGPALQPIRGLIFAIAFFPLRETFFGKNNGWLILWSTLVMLGILSTFGPTPGSFEGLLYTVIPPVRQLGGLLEVLVQSLLLSAILFYWVRNPNQHWIAWLLGILWIVVTLFAVLGFVFAGRTTG